MRIVRSSRYVVGLWHGSTLQTSICFTVDIRQFTQFTDTCRQRNAHLGFLTCTAYLRLDFARSYVSLATFDTSAALSLAACAISNAFSFAAAAVSDAA